MNNVRSTKRKPLCLLYNYSQSAKVLNWKQFCFIPPFLGSLDFAWPKTTTKNICRTFYYLITSQFSWICFVYLFLGGHHNRYSHHLSMYKRQPYSEVTETHIRAGRQAFFGRYSIKSCSSWGDSSFHKYIRVPKRRQLTRDDVQLLGVGIVFVLLIICHAKGWSRKGTLLFIFSFISNDDKLAQSLNANQPRRKPIIFYIPSHHLCTGRIARSRAFKHLIMVNSNVI